jgi:hypothetical protein
MATGSRKEGDSEKLLPARRETLNSHVSNHAIKAIKPAMVV